MPRLSRRAIMNAALPGAPSFHVMFRFIRHKRFGEDLLKMMSSIISLVCALLHYPALRWHGFVLMPTHEHHDMSIVDGDGEVMSKFLHRKSNRFTRLVQAHFSELRLGGILGERAATIPKKTGLAALLDLIYQHNNPVRARLVNNPGDWPFSSYNYYAHGVITYFWEHFLTPLPEYIALAAEPSRRQTLFRLLSAAFAGVLDDPKTNRGLRPRWKVIGDAAFVDRMYEKFAEEIERAQRAGVQGLDGAVDDVAQAVWNKLARIEGDPDPERFAETDRLPACCWMHMDGGQRMALVKWIGAEWDDYRKSPANGRASSFVPSPDLMAGLGPGPAGFILAHAAGPLPGMKDIQRANKTPQPAAPTAPAAPEVKGGAAAEADEGLPGPSDGGLNVADASDGGQEPNGSQTLNDIGSGAVPDSPVTVAGERPMAGEDDGGCDGILENHGEPPGAEMEQAVKKGGALRLRTLTADGAVDLDAWRKEHEALLVECGYQFDELLALLAGCASPPRLRRKRRQIEPAGSAPG